MRRMNKEERQFAVMLALLSLAAGFEGNILASAMWNTQPLTYAQWGTIITATFVLCAILLTIGLLGKKGLPKH